MAWSYSAHTCFIRCKRQYFYSHVAAHHKAKKDALRMEAYYLKQLTQSPLWAGRLVEASVEEVLIKGNPKKSSIVKELYDYSVALGKAQLTFSLSNLFRNMPKSQAGRRYFRLFDHEYRLDDSGILESVLSDVSTCFENYPSMYIPDIGISLSDLLATTHIKKCQMPILFPMFDTTIQCYLDCLILFQSKVIILCPFGKPACIGMGKEVSSVIQH